MYTYGNSTIYNCTVVYRQTTVRELSREREGETYSCQCRFLNGKIWTKNGKREEEFLLIILRRSK